MDLARPPTPPAGASPAPETPAMNPASSRSEKRFRHVDRILAGNLPTIRSLGILVEAGSIPGLLGSWGPACFLIKGTDTWLVPNCKRERFEEAVSHFEALPRALFVTVNGSRICLESLRGDLCPVPYFQDELVDLVDFRGNSVCLTYSTIEIDPDGPEGRAAAAILECEKAIDGGLVGIALQIALGSLWTEHMPVLHRAFCHE